MNQRKRLLAALITALMLSAGAGLGSAEATQAVKPPTESNAEIQRAMTQAVQGNTIALDRLLNSAQANLMRQEVERWAATHPVPQPNLRQGAATQNQAAERTAAGYYDYYCTGYNGVTIGWNGKTFRACHGYWNSYISGNHAQHAMPDVYPSGTGLSVACKKAYTGAGITMFGVLASGPPTGGAGWVAGTAAVAWAAQDVWFSCGRMY